MARKIPKIVGTEVREDGCISFLTKCKATGRTYQTFYLTPEACAQTVYVFGKSEVCHKNEICFYHPTLTADHLTAPTAMSRKDAILKGFSSCRNCN